MYKYLALVIIFFVICYIGYLVKLTYKKKLQFLNEYQNFLEFVLFEIKNNKTEFGKIVDDYLINTNNIFRNLLENYKNNSLIIDEKNIVPKYLFMDKLEIDNINLFFRNISNYSYDNVIVFINKNINLVKDFVINAKKDLYKKGELYFKLSIMLAFFIVIILI